jgi:hypoxanthine phosphoribosyltransferase
MPIVRGKTIDVLFSASVIGSRNLELAKEIASRDFQDLLVISILKGSFIFAADLIRALHDTGLSPEVEFIFISSYGAGTASGEVRILRDIDNSVAGRDVLIIDDILESGKTLKFTRDLMLARGAKSVSIAVLLDKHKRRQTELQADFVGFDCPDSFVVGYGMDVGHAFRELPFVGVVREADQ